MDRVLKEEEPTHKGWQWFFYRISPLLRFGYETSFQCISISSICSKVGDTVLKRNVISSYSSVLAKGPSFAASTHLKIRLSKRYHSHRKVMSSAFESWHYCSKNLLRLLTGQWVQIRLFEYLLSNASWNSLIGLYEIWLVSSVVAIWIYIHIYLYILWTNTNLKPLTSYIVDN